MPAKYNKNLKPLAHKLRKFRIEDQNLESEVIKLKFFEFIIPLNPPLIFKLRFSKSCLAIKGGRTLMFCSE